jgi:hypothetical protein
MVLNNLKVVVDYKIRAHNPHQGKLQLKSGRVIHNDP